MIQLLSTIRKRLRAWLQPSSRPPARAGTAAPDLTPEAAPRLAAVAVHVAAVAHQIELDYSPASLDKVDALILGFRSNGATHESLHESLHKTLLVFGCYVGEVLVRNLAFQWDSPSAMERGVSGTALGLRDPGGGFWNPIGKLYKLAAHGAEDSVVALYLTASRFPLVRSTLAGARSEA